jgi:hypothetical protein
VNGPKEPDLLKEMRMKTAIRWIALGLVLCSLPAFAGENPRRQDQERWTDRGRAVSVDGVLYDRSELDQFKNAPMMFWVIDKAGTFGFTTIEGIQAFGKDRAIPARPEGRKPLVESLVTGPNCSGFNKNVGCGGIDWLPLCTPNTISHISDSWNDVISCVETGSSVGKYTVLYKCYNYDPTYPNCSHIVWIGPGGTLPDLNVADMNNLTSSIRFCSNVDPYSCT